MGRRPVLDALTVAQRNRVIRAIRDGCTQDAAAALVGISKTAWYNTLAKGREPNAAEPYKSFAEDVDQALLASRGKLERAIATDQAWQAKAWMLERRHPKDYGRVLRTEVTGADGGPIEITDRRLEAMLADPVLAADAQALYLRAAGHLADDEDPDPVPGVEPADGA